MKARLLLLVVLAVSVLWLGWWTSSPPEPPTPEETAAATPVDAAPAKPSSAAPQITRPARAEDLIAAAFEKLAQTPAVETAAFLEQLRGDLASYPRAQAAAAAREFLASKRDRITNLPLRIGPDGKLASAPTLRVWLLDELGRIDLNLAAAHAESILASRDSADEWAIALRDYARARPTPEGAAFLRERLRELWNEPRWKQEQSAGWLESFDLAVHLRAADFTRDLTRMIVESKGPERPTAHVAETTLDRLVQVEPAAVLDQLQKNHDWLRGRELTRANYFSRADAQDPQQRALLESYLLDPSRDPVELEKFASLFPNRSRGASNNLITSAGAPSREEVATHEREALRVLDAWEADPRFAAVRPHLGTIRRRLSESAR